MQWAPFNKPDRTLDKNRVKWVIRKSQRRISGFWDKKCVKWVNQTLSNTRFKMGDIA